MIRKENLFIIGYGLGGGFGGINDYEVVNSPDLETASKDAYDRAVDEYESFEGMHGLETYESIKERLEEEGEPFDDSDIDEIYNEELESWLEYTCFPWSKEEEKLARRFHYNNPFHEITSNK